MSEGGAPPIRHKYIKIDPYVRGYPFTPMHMDVEGGYPPRIRSIFIVI